MAGLGVVYVAAHHGFNWWWLLPIAVGVLLTASVSRAIRRRVRVSESPVRVLVPVGMLGGGFPAASIDRGIELGAELIAVDAGSTDSGPHYLGTGTPKTARAAVARDLSVIIPASHRAGIPVVIGSCGTSGTDSGVDWVREIAAEVALDAGISLEVACIYSELDATALEPGSTPEGSDPSSLRDHSIMRHFVAVPISSGSWATSPSPPPSTGGRTWPVSTHRQ